MGYAAMQFNTVRLNNGREIIKQRNINEGQSTHRDSLKNRFNKSRWVCPCL